MSAVTEEKLYKILQELNQNQLGKIEENTKRQTKVLQDEIKSTYGVLQEELAETKKEFDEIKKQNLGLQRKVRRNNIIIFGLDIKKENLLQDCLTKLNHLLGTNLQENDINNIYTLGKGNNAPIILEFISYLKKTLIFLHLKKLQGTRVSINNDLCPEDRRDQKILLKHQKLARSQGLQAKIKGNKLEINEEIYTIQRLLELEEQGNSEKADSESDNSGTEEQNQVKGSEVTNSATKTKIGDESKKRKRRKIQYSPKSSLASTNGGNSVTTRSQTKVSEKDKTSIY